MIIQYNRFADFSAPYMKKNIKEVMKMTEKIFISEEEFKAFQKSISEITDCSIEERACSHAMDFAVTNYFKCEDDGSISISAFSVLGTKDLMKKWLDASERKQKATETFIGIMKKLLDQIEFGNQTE